MNDILAGIVGGAVAGASIAALGMSYGAATGRGFWALPNRIGTLVPLTFGGRPDEFGARTLAGVVLHLVLSAVYGIAIVLIAHHATHAFIATGVVFGIGVWLVNYYGVGAVHPASRAIAKLNPVPVALALHALFGIVAGAIGGAIL